MSFRKAEQLLELATFISSRHLGITLDDAQQRFAVSKRTAQRMLRVFEAQFADSDVHVDPEGRKRWRLRSAALRDLMTIAPEELAALDLALETLRRDSLTIEHANLRALREKVLALVPRSKIAKLETDHEALLEAQGLAARPGPRQRIDREVAAAISEAIKACRILEVHYRGRSDQEGRVRLLAPYGLLTGLRRYLVARDEEDLSAPPKLFVVENVETALVTHRSFERDSTFSLQTFANRAFGVYQNDAEFGDVVWRFSPKAAAHARTFEFHPLQSVEDEPDGSLSVRFAAAGHIEMAWHLYIWGNDVEVLQPEALRKLVEGFQRPDFPALP